MDTDRDRLVTIPESSVSNAVQLQILKQIHELLIGLGWNAIEDRFIAIEDSNSHPFSRCNRGHRISLVLRDAHGCFSQHTVDHEIDPEIALILGLTTGLRGTHA